MVRAVTKRDERIAGLTGYIHCTVSCGQYCHVGDQVETCKCHLIQDASYEGYPQCSKSTSGDMLYIVGDRTYVPVPRMCKKQETVFHRNTQAEIVALIAGQRTEASPFFFLVVNVLSMSSLFQEVTLFLAHSF